MEKSISSVMAKTMEGRGSDSRIPDQVLRAMASHFPAGVVAVRSDDTIGFMNAFAVKRIFGDELCTGDCFSKLLTMCGEPRLLSSLSVNRVDLDSLLVCVERNDIKTYYILSTIPSGQDETVLMLQPAFPLIHEASTEALSGDADETDVMNRLLGQVSHHVSNPLAYIVMNLDILKDTMANLDFLPDQDASRDECEELLTTVGDGVRRITQVVRALQAVNLGRLQPAECVERLEERERRGNVGAGSVPPELTCS